MIMTGTLKQYRGFASCGTFFLLVTVFVFQSFQHRFSTSLLCNIFDAWRLFLETMTCV